MRRSLVTVLTEPLIYEKIQLARKATEFVSSIPGLPARDISLVQSDDMPKRKGLSTREGQGRLLHDLANIELQAVELCFRTLCEFPAANEEFRAELVALMINEVDHLELCLGGLADLGYQWGRWPVHAALWLGVSCEDSLLDRVLIVHRYLEGNGLDSGDMLLKKLNGVAVICVHQIVRKILEDEVHHVEFGSRWYKTLCQFEGLDPQDDFCARFERIEAKVPHRIEKMNRVLRRRAGFTDPELDFLEGCQARWSKFPGRKSIQTPTQNISLLSR